MTRCTYPKINAWFDCVCHYFAVEDTACTAAVRMLCGDVSAYGMVSCVFDSRSISLCAFVLCVRQFEADATTYEYCGGSTQVATALFAPTC